jgi:hypothetical protein
VREGRARQGSRRANLPLLEEPVKVCVPEVGRRELEEFVELVLFVGLLFEKLADLERRIEMKKLRVQTMCQDASRSSKGRTFSSVKLQIAIPSR